MVFEVENSLSVDIGECYCYGDGLGYSFCDSYGDGFGYGYGDGYGDINLK